MSDFYEYVTNLGPMELTGCGGFLCYILAFGSVQFGWLDGNSATYSLANVLAATLVAIGLTAEFNLSSALIQGSWIIIGLTGLALRTRKVLPGNLSLFGRAFEGEEQQ